MIDAVAAELAEIVAPLPRFPKSFGTAVQRPSPRKLPARSAGAWLGAAAIVSALSLAWLGTHADAGSRLRTDIEAPAARPGSDRRPFAAPQSNLPADSGTRVIRPDVTMETAEPIANGLTGSDVLPAAVAERTSERPRGNLQTKVAHPARDHAANWPAAAPVEEACSDDSYRAWCRRGDEQQADRELRQAYRRAVQRGVDTPLLTHVREDWADLRHQAIDDPDQMIEGYRHLDEVLRRATDQMDAQ